MQPRGPPPMRVLGPGLQGSSLAAPRRSGKQVWDWGGGRKGGGRMGDSIWGSEFFFSLSPFFF